MGRISDTIQGLKPAMMMVTVQAALAGVNIFYKLAGNLGMSLRVLIAYRFIFAAAFIVPLALVVERKSRPKLTRVVVCQAFLCGLLGGSLAQNLYAESLVLTSATFAAAMTNLVPAITFILALSFGMERLGFGTWAGKAKVAGTLLCIGGAMLLTFYKGAEINIWSTSVDLLHKGPNHGGHVAASHQKAGNPVLGALLAVCCCFSLAMGLIIQAKMMRHYPCPYSSTAIMITFGAIQATVFALCMEKDWSQWELGWDIKLLTVSYTGIVASGAMFTFMAWCVQMRGPLYVSVFNPLMLVLVALAGSLVLDEKLHLGTVLGAVVIVCGLYTVLWGKGKELKRITQLMPSKSSRESERIEIIISSSAENSININSSSRSSILVVIPNDVSMAYTLDDALDDDVSETNKAKEEEEDDEKEGEQEDANYDDKGKGDNSKATAPKV
ncbi:WAT1-related protein At1g25270-like [Rhododendron vialii]|uniref:WAT1-related protein At1g25270-like n=1 Tax=Rhododendron vialii TaxID=182163 RepID=UPI00265D91FA|nr:WAT1-related protein At1g25270-like [Rhododendron vialii]